MSRRLALPAGLLAAVLLVTAVLPLGAEWYESDRFGVVRGRIPESDLREYEYTVHLERTDDTALQTLYRNGEPVQRSELEYARSGSGDARLLRRTLTVGGVLVATEHYRYWADGSLRSVRHVGDRGSAVEYRYRGSRLQSEWVTLPDGLERTRFDELGRVVDRTRWEEQEVVETETREYWGDAPSDAVRRIVVVADGRELVSRFDESGRLLGTSTARDGAVERDRTRIFEDGLLVEEREQVGDLVRVWRYEYDGEALLRERYSENDVLVRVTDYADPGYTRVETLYRGGEAVLRVSYRDQERVLEEIIRGGEVIRTRDFRPDTESAP